MKGQKKSFRNKIKLALNSLCSRPEEEPERVPKRSPKVMRKQTRQTITFDDVFIKRSRKNIVDEQFFTNDILNLQMQKHLFMRTKGATIGLVKGEFGPQVTNGIRFPVYLNAKPVNLVPHREQILSVSPMLFRPNAIDLMLYQTAHTSDSNKKINGSSEAIKQQITEIQSLMQVYSKSVPNMVLICSQYIDMRALESLLDRYSTIYLYQLENIRKNQQLVCNVIYMSHTHTFLKLNNKCFMEQITNGLGLTIDEQVRFSSLIKTLTDKCYHRQIVQVIRSLRRDQEKKEFSCFSQFVIRIGQYEEVRPIISENKGSLFNEQTIPDTPVLVEPTPAFGDE